MKRVVRRSRIMIPKKYLDGVRVDIDDGEKIVWVNEIIQKVLFRRMSNVEKLLNLEKKWQKFCFLGVLSLSHVRVRNRTDSMEI